MKYLKFLVILLLLFCNPLIFFRMDYIKDEQKELGSVLINYDLFYHQKVEIWKSTTAYGTMVLEDRGRYESFKKEIDEKLIMMGYTRKIVRVESGSEGNHLSYEKHVGGFLSSDAWLYIFRSPYDGTITITQGLPETNPIEIGVMIILFFWLLHSLYSEYDRWKERKKSSYLDYYD